MGPRALTCLENEEVEVGFCAARYETTAFHTLRDGWDGFDLPINLEIGGSAGTGGTERFQPSDKFRDRRLGWDGTERSRRLIRPRTGEGWDIIGNWEIGKFEF